MINSCCVDCKKPLNGGIFRKPNQCPHCLSLQDKSLSADSKSRLHSSEMALTKQPKNRPITHTKAHASPQNTNLNLTLKAKKADNKIPQTHKTPIPPKIIKSRKAHAQTRLTSSNNITTEQIKLKAAQIKRKTAQAQEKTAQQSALKALSLAATQNIKTVATQPKHQKKPTQAKASPHNPQNNIKDTDLKNPFLVLKNGGIAKPNRRASK